MIFLQLDRSITGIVNADPVFYTRIHAGFIAVKAVIVIIVKINAADMVIPLLSHMGVLRDQWREPHTKHQQIFFIHTELIFMPAFAIATFSLLSAL